MNLYRLRGRAEAWSGCGMIDIVPKVSGNQTWLLAAGKVFVKDLKKQKHHYKLVAEKLTVRTPTKEEWMKALSAGDINDLIFGSTIVYRWEG